MPYPREFMDELLSRSDIVSVVSRYVSLSRRGSGHLGLCPFHNEKTPSFSVSQDKQFFHCFGCGVGGDVISFVMKIENIDFPDAVAKLAEWAGIQVPESNYGEAERVKRKRSLSALRDAARFFHSCLREDGGAAARSYLLGRGLSAATITRFGLGYSPDAWSAMLEHLTSLGYSKSELSDAGLISAGKNGSLYDRFRNRAMFPIIDVRGSVIGFGARIMGEGEPKYLNSPESSVFNKRKNLYALNIAKNSKADYMLLAEGYMDVISLHQAGFDSAVASLGTSLTEEQAHLISKYKSRVVISYDSDKAGRAATDRAIEILERAGLDVRVLSMSGAKDPDEYIKKFGRDRFAELIDSAAAASEYKLNSAKTNFDLSDDKQRVAYLKEAVSQLAKIKSKVEREIYAGRIAEETHVSKDAILSEADDARKKLAREKKREEERRALDPVAAMMPKERRNAYKNPRSAIAEEAIVAICATNVKCAVRAAKSLSPETFSSDILSRAFALIAKRAENGEETDMNAMAEHLDSDDVSHIASVFARQTAANADAIDDYINTVLYENLKTAAQNDDESFSAMMQLIRKKKGI